MNSTNTELNNKSGNKRKILGISFGAIILYIIISFATRWMGGVAGETLGKQSVRESATKVGFPASMFGVSWLMSKEECLKIIPDAKTIKDDEIIFYRQFYSREAMVKLTFNNNMLVIFVITFLGPSTIKDFDHTQTLLINDYGTMTAPKQFNNYSMFSEKRSGEFVIFHGLLSTNEINLDQIIIFKQKQ